MRSHYYWERKKERDRNIYLGEIILVGLVVYIVLSSII